MREGRESPAFDGIGLGADAFGDQAGECESRGGVALIGGQRVELPGIFEVLREPCSASFEEGCEVILGLGRASLGGTGEPSDTGWSIGDSELAGEIKKAEFVLGLAEIA